MTSTTRHLLAAFTVILLLAPLDALHAASLLPAGWDPALAGEQVLERLVRVTAPYVKGAHDAEFVCIGDHAYIVEHDNDVAPGHGAGAAQYCVLSVVNLKTLAVEKIIPMAKSEQVFENATLPAGMCFVPRIIRAGEHTLRCYFASQPAKEEALTWYRDFDLRTTTFENRIHRAKIKTAAGVFDMGPRHLHADAVAQGFSRPAVNHGLYIFDSFKEFDGRRYVAINNFPGKQNALALLHDDLATFEVIGHYNEPQAEQLSESAVNRLPDGTWMAICRNDQGNYHFTTSPDGRRWSVGQEMPFVQNGLNSKPTFDQFGGIYYLGWQEKTRIQGCSRSVFNVDISRDGKAWQRKYRFETPHSFQYPTFHEHAGIVWLTVTQSDHHGSTDRIMFGKLEQTGQFESQAGKYRKLPPPEEPALMKPGVKLFTDREYVIVAVPEPVRGLPFLRTSIEKIEAEVTQGGTLYALTPTVRPKAASQEAALRQSGFTKVDVPETQLFPGEINRVSLYRTDATRGARLRFSKAVLLILAPGTEAQLVGASAFLSPVDARTEPPVIITEPGPEFQDDARPGAMILGMDRTPKGRIWGCWTGTGDKQDGYFILATSDNGGGTWSKPRLVVGALDPSGKRQRGALVGNLWTDPLGRLWLFFDQTVIGIPGPRADWFIRCDNPDADAPVWSKPVCFAEGCTLNKPIVLTSGDWLLPVSNWVEETAWVYVSTDQGQSWKPRGSVKFPGWQFDEHMMVELRDGRLWMLARTHGNPYESFSTDHGKTWSAPKPAASVQNTSSRFFLRRLASGRILLVKNGPPTERLKRRSHMSAFLSDDEGHTWRGGLLLDERSSVSYPDGFQAPDGLIHILYDWNRHTDAEILLAKFREEDVLAGRIVSKDAKLRGLANKATGPKPILYNGIELPYEWPPRHFDPASADPMPVPYLRQPPKASIPIDVGRQLFVDDFLIEKTDLQRTFHQARKHPANPVFKAETAEEIRWSGSVYLGHGGVFFDPADQVFKMFYLAGMRGGLAMATSQDLLHWARPQLGLAGGNLLLPPGPRWLGPELKTAGTDNCVWLDVSGSNPSERIKFLTCWEHVPADQRPPGFNHSLHTSADGRRWSPGRPTGVAQDYCSFFYNPFRKLWVFSIKQGGPRGRCRWYAESTDFLRGADWSKSVYWTNADRLDQPEPVGGYPGAGEPTQLYSLSAVAYESVMLGVHMILRGPRNEICDKEKFPKLSDLELGFSRDGFHWDRPDRRPFVAASRKEDAWDRAYLHTTAGVCLVMDDKLWFPYTGFRGVSPDGTRGMYCGGSIGMATLRRDGFASMDAGAKSATLTTRPIKFGGEHLFVNLDAPRGELRVEVLTLENKNYGPFTAETCAPLSCDSTRQRVTWRGVESLARARGKNVKLRFTLTNGALYSFWITPDANGASHGYVAAGGPGFPGTMDTTGN